jgi:hypothetical protein
LNDSDVIDAFVEHLRGRGYPGLKVEERPDKKNRNSRDIDAIAGPFAIEHTSIDALPEQRRDADWFMKAVGGIEKELPKKVSFRLRITIEYTAVKKGQDWDAIRKGLMNWIRNHSPHLTDGRHVLNGVPGVPFKFYVTKVSDRPPGIFFYRTMPPDETLSTRVKMKCDEKAEKLLKYKPHKTTVLLIESDDIALMNEMTIRDAIQKAYPKGPPPGVDHIWYADTSIPDEIEFNRVDW